MHWAPTVRVPGSWQLLRWSLSLAVGIAADGLDAGGGDAAVGVAGTQVADVLAALVGGGVALVAAVAGGIDAGTAAGLTGLDAEAWPGLDRREGGLGDGGAEDGGEAPAMAALMTARREALAADEFGQVIEPAIVHASPIYDATASGVRGVLGYLLGDSYVSRHYP